MKDWITLLVVSIMLAWGFLQTSWLKNIARDLTELRLEIATLKGQDNTINTLMKDIERETKR